MRKIGIAGYGYVGQAHHQALKDYYEVLIEDITPLGRMGDAKDIANIVEFLCSSKSSFLTGNCLMVDGGLSLVGQESIARDLMGLNHEK